MGEAPNDLGARMQMDDLRFKVVPPCTDRRDIERQTTALFAFLQRPFALLSVLDIGTRTIPLDDISQLIAQRYGAYKEPAIFPVSAAQAHFILTRLPSGHVHRPLAHYAREVFWMNCASRPFKCLLQREARIFPPTLIAKINGPDRQNAPGHQG